MDERGRGPGDELLDVWVHGWAVSRGVPPPDVAPGGWRVRVGLPGHRVRYVLRADAGRALAELGRRDAEPGTWIKVAGGPAYLRAALPSAWVMAETLHMMSVRFTTGTATLPEPYAVRLAPGGEVVVASVVGADGEVAASARLAPVGRYGIVDKVETAAAHRRRGLGRAVMRGLSDHAVRLGLHTGVLVATDEGRELYRALGWTVRTPIAAARIPETP